MGRHGENIRHRKSDGRWEGRYKVYQEEKNGYVYRSVYGHTYAEVREKLSIKQLAAKKILPERQSGDGQRCPVLAGSHRVA